MTKHLVAIGNSLGIVIEKPILDLLGFSKETKLKVTTDGQRLIIEPAAKHDRAARVRSLTRDVIKSHEKTFRKLAE